MEAPSTFSQDLREYFSIGYLVSILPNIFFPFLVTVLYQELVPPSTGLDKATAILLLISLLSATNLRKLIDTISSYHSSRPFPKLSYSLAAGLFDITLVTVGATYFCVLNPNLLPALVHGV